MAREEAPASSRVSRRDFLFVAAVGGGAMVVGGLDASPAEAKMSPKAMAYQPSPKGNQRCDTCANFLPPSACKVVDGTISPSGWCILYRSK